MQCLSTTQCCAFDLVKSHSAVGVKQMLGELSFLLSLILGCGQASHSLEVLVLFLALVEWTKNKKTLLAGWLVTVHYDSRCLCPLCYMNCLLNV